MPWALLRESTCTLSSPQVPLGKFPTATLWKSLPPSSQPRSWCARACLPAHFLFHLSGLGVSCELGERGTHSPRPPSPGHSMSSPRDCSQNSVTLCACPLGLTPGLPKSAVYSIFIDKRGLHHPNIIWMPEESHLTPSWKTQQLVTMNDVTVNNAVLSWSSSYSKNQ